MENGVDTDTTPSLTVISKRKVSVALTFGAVMVADGSAQPEILLACLRSVSMSRCSFHPRPR